MWGENTQTSELPDIAIVGELSYSDRDGAKYIDGMLSVFRQNHPGHTFDYFQPTAFIDELKKGKAPRVVILRAFLRDKERSWSGPTAYGCIKARYGDVLSENHTKVIGLCGKIGEIKGEDGPIRDEVVTRATWLHEGVQLTAKQLPFVKSSQSIAELIKKLEEEGAFRHYADN